MTKIVTRLPSDIQIIKGHNGEPFCNYDGHEWRSSSPWHKNHQGVAWDFKCCECGHEHMGHAKDLPRGGCVVRLAPLEWQPEDKRIAILEAQEEA